MALKAGVQVIDFKGVSLTDGTESTIAGTYEAVTHANKKPTLCSGIVIGTAELPSFFAPFIDISDVMTAEVDIGGVILKIEIADDDGVTVTDITPTP